MASAGCWPPRKNKPVEWLAAARLPVGDGNCGTLCGLGVFVDQAAEPVPALNAHTSHSPAIPGAAIAAGRATWDAERTGWPPVPAVLRWSLTLYREDLRGIRTGPAKVIR
jgi:hypothetical protein